MINWLKRLFKTIGPCKACNEEELYWNSICGKCGYYQHSCMSPLMYNYLKEPGNAERLYSNIIDRNPLRTDI